MLSDPLPAKPVQTSYRFVYTSTGRRNVVAARSTGQYDFAILQTRDAG